MTITLYTREGEFVTKAEIANDGWDRPDLIRFGARIFIASLSCSRSPVPRSSERYIEAVTVQIPVEAL